MEVVRKSCLNFAADIAKGSYAGGRGQKAFMFRGRQAPPKPEVKRALTSKPPRRIPRLLTMTWMGQEGKTKVYSMYGKKERSYY
jgi:hypothetical protein